MPWKGISPFMVKYQAHVQDVWWQSWVKDGEIAGTTGQSKRMEAIRIRIRIRIRIVKK
ncbi:hypothetical protein [Clostridium vincentii]|uniref:hypothetical protein n=1 Tax=Clostridium vincentii TaxID=52704 RepID=UPI000D0383FA|nr:hypothetical protein [Clostridium vincentii]